jgi:hypothetical protein
MQFTNFVAASALFTTTTFAANCNNAPGVANGECVKYFSTANCAGSFKLGEYKPDCSGSCFKYDSFQAIHVGGDGTYGTDCKAYSDDNCQSPLQDSGNVVVGAGKWSVKTPSVKRQERTSVHC